MTRVPERDIVVIGGSAGSIQPLKQILASLPADLPASVFVVVHIPSDASDEMVCAMVEGSSLPVRLAQHGDPIEHGHVYVARPDHHLMLGIDELRVVRGPHENRTRPAIDPTLRTAAKVFDGRVVAVVLSGDLNDGTYGAMVVKARGGTVIAQDPAEADYPAMPRSLVERAVADHVLPAAQIAAQVESLIWSTGPQEQPNPFDAGLDELERVSRGHEIPDGTISPYTCPECSGPLWLKEDGSLSRFRCHTGHAFTGETLLAGQKEDLETALWSAVRVLDEHALLCARLGKQAISVGAGELGERHLQRAKETEVSADRIRELLL